MNIYQKLALRFAPKNYYSKSAYDMIPSNYTSFDQILKVYKYASMSNQYNTRKQISFKNDLDLGSSKRTVYKRLGKPYAEFKNPYIKDHTILCYKFLLGMNKARCEIHLYRNRFFLGLYTLDYTSNFQVVRNELVKKYVDTGTDQSDLVITDKMNHQILIKEQIMNFVVMYFLRNEELYDHIHSLIEQREKIIREQEREIIFKLKRDL